MEALDVIKRIEDKILQINKEANQGLENLNKQAEKMYHLSEFQDDNGDFTNLVTPESYYSNVARYAWGYRGRQIAILYLQGEIDNIKKELNL